MAHTDGGHMKTHLRRRHYKCDVTFIYYDRWKRLCGESRAGFSLTSAKDTAILISVIRLQKLAGPAIGGASAEAPLFCFLMVTGGDLDGQTFFTL